VVCGDQVVDFRELEKAVKYEGFTLKSPVIKWFWELMHSL